MKAAADCGQYDLRPRAAHIWEIVEGPMRVPDRILSCVVFVGLAEHGPFAALGTGFLTYTATDGFNFQQVITARHVIEGVKTDTICLRANTKDGRLAHLQTERAAWKFHPDPSIDLAACPTHIPPEQFDILHMHVDREMATPDIIAKESIGVGDDVFMAGMFTRHLGDVLNRPIVRVGTIAAMSNEHERIYTPRGHVSAYLIEARSIAGLSGSPVFVHMAPFRVMPDGAVRQSRDKTHYFLGVMQGHFVTREAKETMSPDGEAPGDMSTGIGVVIPAERVREIIDLPEFKKGRQKVVDAQKRQSGFVEDSVKAPKWSVEENSRHREDFNRLLSAAVKPPKSSGQT